MKNLVKKHNLIFAILILTIGIALGVLTSTSYNYLAGINKIIPKSQAEKVADETQIKKDALASFYKQIYIAADTQDWAKLYEFTRPSLKANVTKEQFIAFQKENAGNEKSSTKIHSIEVKGNKGYVDRTVSVIADCRGKENCTASIKEDREKMEYDYVNGKWQVPDLEPSERALKAANYGYINSSQADQKVLVNRFGYGSENLNFILHNWAVYLDKNLEDLNRIETLKETVKTDNSSSTTYTRVNTPSNRALAAAAGFFKNLSASDQEKILKANNWSSSTEAINATALVLDSNPAKLAEIEVVVKNFYNSDKSDNNMHCTSNRIGDSISTNCY